MSIGKEIRRSIAQNVALDSGGNSHRSLQNVAVDLINASGMSWKEVASGCFLCTATVKNLATGKTRFPRADTLDRVYRFYEYKIGFRRESIKSEFQNHPKVHGL